MSNKVKILELCHFSEGICGVWNRVKEESTRLADLGYEVRVFSSNAIKGSKKKAPFNGSSGKVKIKRFPYVKLGGESYLDWDFRKSALEYEPEIIIANNYRHLHTTKALEIKKELKKRGKNCKVFLVTHAPFNISNSSRGLFNGIVVSLYDKLVGKRKINKFDKIISISKWERPYLENNLNVMSNKIEYIPNGAPEEFFKNVNTKQNNKMLFLGRLSPIKNIDLAISALSKMKKEKLSFEIVGPVENNYEKYLKRLVDSKNLNNDIKFSEQVYDIREKIKKIDSANFFILPSKREGMPQSLIEAMARGRIPIGSSADGIKAMIDDGVNGFIFNNMDVDSAAKVLDKVLSLDYNKRLKIMEKSRKSVDTYRWDKLIVKLDNLIKSELK